MNAREHQLLLTRRQLFGRSAAGIRVKLASRGFGRWKESGGEKSKFGLNSAQLMQAIEKLTALVLGSPEFQRR